MKIWKTSFLIISMALLTTPSWALEFSTLTCQEVSRMVVRPNGEQINLSHLSRKAKQWTITQSGRTLSSRYPDGGRTDLDGATYSKDYREGPYEVRRFTKEGELKTAIDVTKNSKDGSMGVGIQTLGAPNGNKMYSMYQCR